MPRRRYQHLWRQAKGTSLPTRLVVADCDVRTECVSRRPRVEREYLAGYSAVYDRLARGVVVRRSPSIGTTAGEFWSMIDGTLHNGCTTWLLIDRACRFLSLVGFWELLENGQVTPVASDTGHNHHNRRAVPGVQPQATGDATAGEALVATALPYVQSQQGRSDHSRPRVYESPGDGIDPRCLVLEDPPTVLAVRRTGRGGTLLVCDLRQYGWESERWAGGAADRCAQQERAVVTAIGTIRQHSLGSWRCTAGSQAVQSLRTADMAEPLYVHTFGPVLRLERDAYYGGRCECYRIGDVPGPVYQLDVRSLYPSVCVDGVLPTFPVEHYDGDDAARVFAEGVPPLCVADITISTPEPAYPIRVQTPLGSPPVPADYRRGRALDNGRGALLFAVGRFRTCMCGPEAKDAARHGRVVCVHRLAVYDGSPALSRFMRRWYALLEAGRAGGDAAQCDWIKRVMVSLVGKMGEQGREWVGANYDPSHGPYADWTQARPDGMATRYRTLGNRTYREVSTPESAESIPAVAAYVTSLGRMRLLELIRIAGWAEVYYCDTDSLLTSQAGYDRLCAAQQVRDSQLGYLRLLRVAERCRIYGQKHYLLDGHYVCAGIPRRGQTGGSEADNEGSRPRAAGRLEAGEAPRAERVIPDSIGRKRYKHGVVGADGRVTPWTLLG